MPHNIQGDDLFQRYQSGGVSPTTGLPGLMQMASAQGTGTRSSGYEGYDGGAAYGGYGTGYTGAPGGRGYPTPSRTVVQPAPEYRPEVRERLVGKWANLSGPFNNQVTSPVLTNPPAGRRVPLEQDPYAGTIYEQSPTVQSGRGYRTPPSRPGGAPSAPGYRPDWPTTHGR